MDAEQQTEAMLQAIMVKLEDLSERITKIEEGDVDEVFSKETVKRKSNSDEETFDGILKSSIGLVYLQNGNGIEMRTPKVRLSFGNMKPKDDIRNSIHLRRQQASHLKALKLTQTLEPFKENLTHP